jgi:hypothetical protein
MNARTLRLLQYIAIAFAALLAVLPLALHGYSCGHDFDFHLRSWMEASAQWHGGIVKPIWAFHAAWNAGEPRLLFYPPLSWTVGALLTTLLPWTAVSTTFTWLVLFLSGLAMHRLARRWTTSGVATLAGCVYLANPYMLFCAYERTAYAELMAAAWMPLLLAALLRSRISVWRVAAAVSLLWLTNAPAGVVGCYTVLLVGAGRLLLTWRKDRTQALHYAGALTAGVALGLFADAFYLLPMAIERRYVQLNLAIVPNARPDANFLFTHTGDEFHDGVLSHSSWIAVGLVALAVVCGVAIMLLHRQQRTLRTKAPTGESSGLQPTDSTHPAEGLQPRRAFHSMHDRDAHTDQAFLRRSDTRNAATIAVPVLTVFSAFVIFLLASPSAPIWHVAPELVFLQFPWRFLAVQAAVSILLLALLIERLGELRGTARLRWPALAAGGLCIAGLAGFLGADNGFRQGCDDEEGLEVQRLAFTRGDGFEQTDEYTPVGADNDTLEIKLPHAWIATGVDGVPAGRNGEPVATTLLPHEDQPRPDDMIFQATTPAPGEFLVVRLRSFHGWHVTRDGVETTSFPQRHDGLLAVPLTGAGPHRIEVRYRKTADQWLGAFLSLLGIASLIVLRRKEA